MPDAIEALQAAVQAEFPWWVRWGPCLGIPVMDALFAGVLTGVLAWVAGRPFRKARPMHWVEQARLAHSHTVVSMFGVFVSCIFAAFWRYVWVAAPHPLLGPAAHGAVTVVTLGAVLATASWMVWRTSPKTRLRAIGFGEWLQGWSGWLLVMYPYLVILVGSGLWLLGWIDSVWARSAVAGVIGMAALGRGHWPLLCALGLVSAPSSRVRAVVARAAAACGVAPREVGIIRWRAANAFILPWRRALVFTEALEAELDDEALFAICCHELAHLREPGHVRWIRSAPCLYLALVWAVPVSWSRPGGAEAVTLALLLLLFVVVSWSAAVARRYEAIADAVALHMAPADYARAMERLYAVSLTPVVLRSRTKSHPDLYDRLMAMGYQPAYPRPAPPPRGMGAVALGLALLLIGGAIAGRVVVFKLAGHRLATWRIYASVYGTTAHDLRRYAGLLHCEGRADDAARWVELTDRVLSPSAR